MSAESFAELIGEIAGSITGRALDSDLEAYLNATYPAEGEAFQRLKQECQTGEAEGWLVSREAGGVKFGRAIKPDTSAAEFSVDVVRMKDVRGPHHVHTTGEIGAIMALDGEPRFDGKPEGWYVYGPGSAHFPTVRGGDAYVLYLLPGGAIEFTGK
ncbi:DUF4863 family protein [Actibacterium sp.]|uniref:4-hydroxylaminobenzoate lyase n=1 Tax=Actibacterium sp. TaxID=1872125 RepID=UPI003562D4D8